VSEPAYTLLVGDVLERLAELPDDSVDCVVTSPPYWGLRDYGVDGQIGLEETFEEFVDTLVGVFRELRRVLAPHGTCWVNLGDSYNSRLDGSHGGWNGSCEKPQRVANDGVANPPRPPAGLKPKDLLGQPWAVAFALRADGWCLRSCVIWHKPNPMPESVTDRPTTAHEYVFLLAKQPRYFYDAEAVREPTLSLDPEHPSYRPNSVEIARNGRKEFHAKHEMSARSYNPAGRNLRSVWTIPTHPYPEAHFATYPPALVERCLLAGAPKQVCRTCGKPRKRIVERGESDYARIRREEGISWTEMDKAGLERGVIARAGEGGQTRRANGTVPSLSAATSTTLGFTDCGHDDYRRGVVLDPFAGSGTTLVVACRLGLDSIGIELNPEYAELAERRLARWWEEPKRARDVPDGQLPLEVPA